MTNDQMPTVTTRLRWKGESLWAGAVFMGRVGPDFMHFSRWLSLPNQKTIEASTHATEPEARAALLAAAVKALADE